MQLNLDDLMAAYRGLGDTGDYYAASLRQLIAEREDMLRCDIARLAAEASLKNGWTAEHRDRLLHFAEKGTPEDLESTYRNLSVLLH